MTTDVQVTITFLDGKGTAQTQLSVADALGNVAPQTALRANSAIVGPTNPLPTAPPPLAYSLCNQASVGASSAQLVAAGACGRCLTVTSLPGNTGNVWLNVVGGAAVVGQGILVPPGGKSITFGSAGLPIPTAAIFAITDAAGAQTVALAGG